MIEEADESAASDDELDEVPTEYSPKPSDVPQAFSCWTYRYTKRKMLVCDLQGVLQNDENKYEFTDPVIHYRSRSGRTCVFGITDRGRKGATAFFQTHVCSDLCKLLRKRKFIQRDAAIKSWDF